MIMKFYIFNIQFTNVKPSLLRLIAVPSIATFQNLHKIILSSFELFAIREFYFETEDHFILETIDDYFEYHDSIKYSIYTYSDIEFIANIVCEDVVDLDFNYPITFYYENKIDFLEKNYEIVEKQSFKNLSDFLIVNYNSFSMIDDFHFSKCNNYLLKKFKFFSKKVRNIKPKNNEGYYLKLRLMEVSPHTWRDIIIPHNLTFNELHHYIQIIFNFDCFHLYKFIIEGDIYCTNYDMQQPYDIIGFEGFESVFDTVDTCVYYFFNRVKYIDYIYDYGDYWHIRIEIKKTKELNQDYPKLVRYKGDYNPFEDCGGANSLMDYIEIAEKTGKLTDELSLYNQDEVQKKIKEFKREK